MGSASSKFKKYLQHGDEFAAMQVYQSSPDLRENLDPSSSYGESHNHNTPLHYAAKHGMKHLVRAFLSDHGGSPNKRNNDDENSLHCVCRVGQAKSPSAEERRTMCVSIMLMWRGPLMQDGEKEKPQLNAQDKKGNTALHYSSASGLRKCVDLLVFNGASLFLENKERMTSCDMAVKAGHLDIAAFLESKMVFADVSDTINENPHLTPSESDEGDSEVYAGLRAQDLQEAKDQLLVETADMLHIPLFTAEALLRDNEWSKTLLLEKWMSNALQCCQMAGIAPPTSALFAPSPPMCGMTSPLLSNIITPPPLPIIPGQDFGDSQSDSSERSIVCEICYGGMSMWEINTEGPSCGHRFCSCCWENYLTLKILEGGAHHILCPAVDCNILIDVDFIEKMVSPAIARKYLQFDIEAFVERNKTIKWCPLPGCGRAVRFPEAELAAQTIHFPTPVVNHLPKMSHAVDCGNGHFFCWDCLGEAHSPCGCDQWMQWQSKIAEVRPEELKVSSGETEDAANFLWLVTNSKPCPNCKSPIQKNEGCNHMKCSKCKFVFCWICLESWKKHSSATGGYFRCNKYGAQMKADEKLGVLVSEASVHNQEMQELSRFIHYYSRFKSHQNAIKTAEPLFREAKAKMANLAKSLPYQDKNKKGTCEKETLFLEDGLKELLKCRRVLSGSYVYGYYLQDNGYNRTIFEFMQNELEDVVEKLSDMVAREYLVTPRGQIVATTILTRRRRHKFVRAIARGLLPPDTPPGLRKARRRRIPSHMGMDPKNDLEAIEAMGRVLDSSQPWVKDNSGRHTNLAVLLDWPDLDSDDEESSLNQALTLTLLGKCSRKQCPRPRARNPRTGTIHNYCSLHCAQQAAFLPNTSTGDPCSNTWDGCDSTMELLIALEMSRLQMIEDEARRRQSWLQEHHRWTNGPHETDPYVRPSTSTYFGSVDDIHENYHRTMNQHFEGGQPGNCSQPPTQKNYHTGSWPRNRHCTNTLSSAEIAVDYFLKKLSNNDISLRNLNIDTEQDNKIDKHLFCFPKKEAEDGRFKYEDSQDNEQMFSFFPLSDIRRDLRRSQSLGDLTDRSSSLELDSDHAHQDFPEAVSKLYLPLNRIDNIDRESGNNTDQGVPFEVLDSPVTDLEVKGILSHLNSDSNHIDSEPLFQLVVDEGTDKEESNSTERSSRTCDLRIHISHPNETSLEFESETGIPNSPTLYISGVSISRSPEPRSPKSALASKENRSPSLSLPLSRTPEPRTGNYLHRLSYTRSRSSSLIVPSTATQSAYLDPSYYTCLRYKDALSSLSLQPTRASSPFLLPEMRMSKSASETEKGRLVFQFPKSPTEGALSSILHVEESTLSSDDFHEALFLSKSPKPSKRKKSKRERNNKEKSGAKSDETKEKSKETKDRYRDKRKLREISTAV